MNPEIVAMLLIWSVSAGEVNGKLDNGLCECWSVDGPFNNEFNELLRVRCQLDNEFSEC